MGGAEIRVSEPVVAFRETVTATSDHVVMSKSPNKHNRLYMQARAAIDALLDGLAVHRCQTAALQGAPTGESLGALGARGSRAPACTRLHAPGGDCTRSPRGDFLPPGDSPTLR